MNETRRKSGLDFLRIVATIIIVFHHYMQVSGKFPGFSFSFYENNFYFGYLVELFFILSGFLTFRYIDLFDEGYKFKDFYLKKYIRFIPMLFASSVLYYILNYIYLSLFNKAWITEKIHISDIILNTLGINSGWIFECNYLNYPLWYISVLLLCYLLFFLTTWFAIRSKLPRITSYVVVFVLGFIIRLCLEYELFGFIPFINGHSSRGYCAFFFGILIGFFINKKNKKWKDYLFSLLLFVSIAIFLAFFSISLLQYYILIWIYGLVLMLFSNDLFNKIFDFKIFNLLGGATYYVFVWQVPAILLTVILKNTKFSFITFNSWLTMFVFCIILFVICTFMSVVFKQVNKSFNKVLIKHAGDSKNV